MSVERAASWVFFPLFIIAILLVVFLFRDTLSLLYASPETVREWVAGKGLLAPLVFVLLQIVQVVLFIIPGEVPQIAGGYLFGVAGGTLLSLLGILAGSGVNFYIGRAAGKPFIRTLFGEEKFNRYDRFLYSPRGVFALFLFFLIPGIPKDILCYLAGISRLSFLNFLLISMGGRLPALIASTVIGDAAAEQRWVVGAVLMGLAVILFLLGTVFHKRLLSFIERRLLRRGKEQDRLE